MAPPPKVKRVKTVKIQTRPKSAPAKKKTKKQKSQQSLPKQGISRMPTMQSRKQGPNGSMSMVTDGVNVGSVWKNTTAERVRFPMSREKVTDLTSASTAFQMLSQLYVNPGNSTLFPIFSQIASCYEEYVPTHLRFIFRTEEYMASGSTVSAGLVAFTTNFDVNDSNFGNITTLENYEHAISGPPFSGVIIHDALAEHKKRFKNKSRDLSVNNYYVYPSANSIGPSTDQAKWYDIGNFQLACNGCQAGIIGELWVEYAFTMIRRKQPEFPIGGSALHLYIGASDGTAASPLGLTPYTSRVERAGSTLSAVNMAGDLALYTSSTVGLNDAADTRLNLPNASATWFVSTFWFGTGIAAVPAVAASGGATLLDVFSNDSSAGPGLFLAAGTRSIINSVVTTTATSTPVSTSNSLVYSGNTTMSAANVDIYIIRIPNALVTLFAPQNRDHDSILQRLLQLESRLSKNEVKDDESDSEHFKLVSPDLSASYISRVGDALGIARSVTRPISSSSSSK